MTVRIGVALAIPEPWRTELFRWRSRVRDPQADAVPPHITLLPPTAVKSTELEKIELHLVEVAERHCSFELHLRGAGTFRPVSDVVFVVVARGISDCEVLEEAIRSGPLQRDLQFPYHPHVTVAQDVDPAALDVAYEGLAGFDALYRVQGLSLFVHGSDGVWRPHQYFPFGCSSSAAAASAPTP